MANMFDEFDAKMDKGFAEKVKEAAENSDFPEAPKGKYNAKLEKLEMTKTKKDGRPMFAAQFRLVVGAGLVEREFLARFKNKKPCIFLNRVVFGTKNDASMIGSVVAFLNKLIDDPDNPVVFTTYSDLAEEIMDIAEDFVGTELDIEYDPNAFNSIKILDA